ncbi:AMP-binding protein [Sorangium sp. So ce861]|uniref:AMP-binding protein n=1 Tax=Sorangium sp. So ce861 TaxID=3133323 RepID=UPI003F63BCA6
MPPSAAPLLDPERLDLRAACETLRQGKADGAWLRGWLPATYDDPAGFRRALYAHASRQAGGLKSRPGEGVDLYHDCVMAHLGQRRRALLSAGAAGSAELSFEAVHARAAALASSLLRAGFAPGQAVAVVLPAGVDLVVAVLAALRAGAVVSTVPPAGPAFVEARLDQLKPDHVIAAERHRRLLGRFSAALVGPAPAAAPDDRPQPSHWYAPDEPVARLLSPFGDPAAGPVELTAAAWHEALLRDGHLVFGLAAGDTLAAPGFDPVQFQPHLALAALAAGAAYAELGPEDALADPGLAGLDVTVLGVGRRLRDELLRRGVAALPKACRAWFWSLTEVLDADRWHACARALWARKIPGFGVVASAAAAGVHLFGPPAPPAPVPRVWPAPGRAWQLSELAAGELPALRDVGVYTPLRDEEPDLAGLPRVVLSREPDDLLFAGAIDLGRDAQTYPAAEVARVAERHPAVRHAAAVVAPGRHVNDARAVLIAFVEDLRGPDGRLALPVRPDELAALVAREMGERAAPDRVEIFPLRPRLRDGVVDEAWCRSQYLGGTLHTKARMELFVLLSRLRTIVGRAPSGP